MRLARQVRGVSQRFCLLAAYLSVAMAARASFAQDNAGHTVSPEVLRLNDEGLAALETGDHQLAILRFESALRLEPNQAVLKDNLANAHILYGHALIESDRAAEAIPHFLDAQRLAPDNNGGYIGLINLYYADGDLRRAESELGAYLRRFPQDGQALRLQGEIYYQTGRLSEALATWKRALGLLPDDEALQSRIEKVAREYAIEARFRERRSQHFRVRYAHEHLSSAAPDVLRGAENARRELGRDLRGYPEGRTEIVLYDAEQFGDATLQREHVAGLYDGKIRIRIPDESQDAAYLDRVIRHEYAHRLIHDIAGDRCPYWLNEGLAQWVSEPFTHSHRTTLRGHLEAAQFPRLHAIESLDVAQTSSEELMLTNLTAFAAVDYLRTRYPKRLIVDLLHAIAGGQPAETALRDLFGHDYTSLDEALVAFVSED